MPRRAALALIDYEFIVTLAQCNVSLKLNKYKNASRPNIITDNNPIHFEYYASSFDLHIYSAFIVQMFTKTNY